LSSLAPERHFGERGLIVGQRQRRRDAPDKVKGTALYVSDLAYAGTLVAGVLRSPHPHARITELDTTPARSLPGVRAVLTGGDLPGENVVPLAQADWPILAGEFVRHVGEAVAVVAAEDAESCRRALAAIAVEYQPLVATLDPETALAAGEVMAHFKIRRGEASVALSRSDLVVVEETYHTPWQSHVALETQGALAVPDGSGGVVVHAALESPFPVQRAVASATGLDLNRVRVVQAVTGGGFGSKEESAAPPAAQAAVLALATGRPVRLLFSREEEMAATCKRHAARIRMKTGATRDGHLFAAEIDVLLDGGAYATASPAVLFRSAVHAAGPYRVPNVKVDARVVRTHKVPAGSFRGLGVPQVAFAAESQMNRLAERLDMDPLDLRRRNALGEGDEMITGQQLTASVGLRDVLGQVAEASDFARKRKAYATAAGPVRRGIGLAAGYSGIGLGSLGKHANPAGAAIIVSPDGSVTVAVGTADAGQGTAIALVQIAAESLGCPLELVRLVESDTSRVPDSGPSSSSRGTLMSGNAIRDAAEKIRAAMEPVVGEGGLAWRDAVFACVKNQVGLAAHGWAVPPPTTFDSATGQGDPFVAYTFSAAAVEVEVDIETGETKVLHVVSGHDAGRIVNPTAAEGQVEGGVAQALGYALLEEHRLQDGRVANDSLSSYMVPTALDAPDTKTLFVEHAFPWGPFGAKGLSDATVVAVAPAAAAAVAQAAGVELAEIPATPERILRARTAAREKA
jgi:CO/xanthine dehydrogenase Mo-binding subunit